MEKKRNYRQKRSGEQERLGGDAPDLVICLRVRDNYKKRKKDGGEREELLSS